MMPPQLLRGGLSGGQWAGDRGATEDEASEGLAGDSEAEAWSISASRCSLV